MAPLRHAALTFQGPFRFNSLQRLPRRRASPPSPAPSPPPPPPAAAEAAPNSTPSLAIPPPSPPPAAAEATPHPTPSLATPLSSSGTARNASPLLGPPGSSSGTPSAASLPVTSPRATNKRKADDSLLPETEFGADRKKMRSGETSSSSAEAVVWKMLTLDEIRALPPSATRPFYPRTLRRGVRSIKEPEPWKRSECGNLNHLTRHLLFDLPAFKCKGCNAEPRKGEADFGFCYSDLAINEACPIGHVKAQRPGECIPNTLSSCVEITHRITATLLEQPVSKEGPFIDIDDLLVKYEKRWLEEGYKNLNEYDGYSLVTMIKVFQFDGVKEKKTSGSNKKTKRKLHHVAHWAFVNQKDFAALSSAVADGYPLIVLYKLGPKTSEFKARRCLCATCAWCRWRSRISAGWSSSRRGG